MRTGLLAALLSAGLLAGCGGDEAAQQTKAQFVAEADVVCAGVADDLQRRGSANPRSPAEIAQANTILADAYGELGDGLSKLELPPGADQAGAKAYIDSVKGTDPALAKLRSSGQALVDAANGSDARALTDAATGVRTALDDFRKARADSDLLAVQYGMSLCGNLG